MAHMNSLSWQRDWDDTLDEFEIVTKRAMQALEDNNNVLLGSLVQEMKGLAKKLSALAEHKPSSVIR